MTIPTTILKYNGRSDPVEPGEEQLSESLSKHEMLVRTSYIALNPMDIKLKAANLFGSGNPGHEFSGTVEKVGSAAAAMFSPGDKVCGLKTLTGTVGSTTKISAYSGIVLRHPKTLSDAQSAALPVAFGTAFGLLRAGSPLTQESSVLVLGGSTCVGISTMQLLKTYYKVQRVVATCSQESQKFVKGYGADETIDYKAYDFKGRLVDAAAKTQFDNVYDCVGGTAALEVGQNILKPDGTYVSCVGDTEYSGSYSIFAPGQFAWTNIKMGFRYLFSGFYGFKYRFVMIGRKDWPLLAPRIVDECKITVPIDSTWKAKDVHKAWERLNTGHVRGKVVVDMQ